MRPSKQVMKAATFGEDSADWRQRPMTTASRFFVRCVSSRDRRSNSSSWSWRAAVVANPRRRRLPAGPLRVFRQSSASGHGPRDFVSTTMAPCLSVAWRSAFSRRGEAASRRGRRATTARRAQTASDDEKASARAKTSIASRTLARVAAFGSTLAASDSSREAAQAPSASSAARSSAIWKACPPWPSTLIRLARTSHRASAADRQDRPTAMSEISRIALLW